MGRFVGVRTGRDLTFLPGMPSPRLPVPVITPLVSVSVSPHRSLFRTAAKITAM